MRNNSLVYIFSVVLFVCGTTSCHDTSEQVSEDLISKAFLQKIESFKQNKRQECLSGIMVDAEVLVDSIIAQQLNLDTIDFPRKPIKPNSPNLKDIPEEFELAPIKK